MTAADVRAVIEVRQLRRRYLGFEADDAAWSMMLELYATRLEARPLHQTLLSVRAGVPETTALRVTRRMLASGLFTAEPHSTDKRLVVIAVRRHRRAHPRLSGRVAGARRIGRIEVPP